MANTEADTCRKYVLPKLIEAGRDNDPHSLAKQRTFTDGLQQAKNYTEMLGLKFAYFTNGREIVEFESPSWTKSKQY